MQRHLALKGERLKLPVSVTHRMMQQSPTTVRSPRTHRMPGQPVALLARLETRRFPQSNSSHPFYVNSSEKAFLPPTPQFFHQCGVRLQARKEQKLKVSLNFGMQEKLIKSKFAPECWELNATQDRLAIRIGFQSRF